VHLLTGRPTQAELADAAVLRAARAG
jgi:hypothetical protein